MIKAILLDCGGVMVSPATGDWMLPPGYEAHLGEDFLTRHADAFRAGKAAWAHRIPDAHPMHTDDQEYEMLVEFYRGALVDSMGMNLPDGAVEAIASLQAYGDDRYHFFGDVREKMRAWRERYLLGMVSDAPPSLGRIMRVHGYWDLLHTAVLSCDIGALKPDPRMYLTALEALNVARDEAVYVDDIPEKLQGARDLGIACIQMRRNMHALFRPAPRWDGPVVSDFEGLEREIERMQGRTPG